MLESDIDFFRKIKKEKQKRNKIQALGDRLKEPNLLALSQVLDEYFFLEKLRLYCAYLSYTKIVNPNLLNYTKDDFRLLQVILQTIDSGFFSNPRLEIYNQIRKLYENIEMPKNHSDTQYYYTFQLIHSSVKSLKYFELEEMYSFLSNYCVRRINMGEKEYAKNYFLISLELLELKCNKKAKNKKKLPGSFFKNIIISALKLKQSTIFIDIPVNQKIGYKNVFEWIEAFITSYAPKLNKKDYNTYVPYCRALVAFEQENFARAYKLLQNPLGQRGIFINMNIKVLHLKILYEINLIKPSILEYDGIKIEKVLESYRSLLRDERNRKQELNYQFEFYSLFEKVFKKIYNFHCKYDGKLFNKENKQFLEEKDNLQKLVNEVNFSYKDWITEKFNSIK